MKMLLDNKATIAELRERVRKFIDDRDWGKYHNPKDIAISISIEASELLELFQWVKEDELTEVISDPRKFAMVREELADIVIYCLSLANVANFDIAQAVARKIEKNEQKYPIQQVKGDYKKCTKRAI